MAYLLNLVIAYFSISQFNDQNNWKCQGLLWLQIDLDNFNPSMKIGYHIWDKAKMNV